MSKNILTTIVIMVVIAIAVGGYFYPSIVNFGASAGPDHTEAQNFYGGVLRGSAIATSSTATSITVPISWLKNVDFVAFTPNVGATTLTLPASSTVSSFVPKAGNTQQTCLYNATSTATATLTIATAAGLDLVRVATSTTSGSAGMITIPAGGIGCFTFVREPATAAAFDIAVMYTPFRSAE